MLRTDLEAERRTVLALSTEVGVLRKELARLAFDNDELRAKRASLAAEVDRLGALLRATHSELRRALPFMLDQQLVAHRLDGALLNRFEVAAEMRDLIHARKPGKSRK
jgi:hypothetical protein